MGSAWRRMRRRVAPVVALTGVLGLTLPLEGSTPQPAELYPRPQPVDGADDPVDGRLARARAVHHADVAVPERLHRRHHLLAVVAIGNLVGGAHARLAGHETDRLVR